MAFPFPRGGPSYLGDLRIDHPSHESSSGPVSRYNQTVKPSPQKASSCLSRLRRLTRSSTAGCLTTSSSRLADLPKRKACCAADSSLHYYPPSSSSCPAARLPSTILSSAQQQPHHVGVPITPTCLGLNSPPPRPLSHKPSLPTVVKAASLSPPRLELAFFTLLTALSQC